MPLSREMLEELALDNFASDLLKDEELDFADALQQARKGRVPGVAVHELGGADALRPSS